MKIRVKLNPSPVQQEILKSVEENRVTVVAAGRRTGKTLAAMMAMFLWAITHPRSKIIFAAPTNFLAKSVWMEMKKTPGVQEFLDPRPPAFGSGSYPVPYLLFRNQSTIQFLTMDKTQNKKRGAGANLIVLDECREIPEQTYTSILWPMVASTRGHVLLTSTFRGKDHWFYRLYEKGSKPNDMKMKSFLFPSSMGIAFQGESGKRELELMKAGMSEAEFRVEFLCEAIQTGQSVFKEEHLNACLDGVTQTGSTAPTLMPIDMGRVKDPTAWTIMAANGHLINSNVLPLGMDWDQQFTEIQKVAAKYNSTIILETNGTNSDSMVALVKARMPGVTIKPVMVRDDIKESLVRRVQYDLEKRMIHIPPTETEMIKQLRQYEVTRAGRTIGMENPQGHDDLVIALALACHGRAQGWLPTGPGISIGHAF